MQRIKTSPQLPPYRSDVTIRRKKPGLCDRSADKRIRDGPAVDHLRKHADHRCRKWQKPEQPEGEEEAPAPAFLREESSRRHHRLRQHGTAMTTPPPPPCFLCSAQRGGGGGVSLNSRSRRLSGIPSPPTIAPASPPRSVLLRAPVSDGGDRTSLGVAR